MKTYKYSKCALEKFLLGLLTKDKGPIVKWYNASMAWTRAGSDSPWVHKNNERSDYVL